MSIFTDGHDLTNTHENNKYHLYSPQHLPTLFSYIISHTTKNFWIGSLTYKGYDAEVDAYSKIKTGIPIVSTIVFQLKW